MRQKYSKYIMNLHKVIYNVEFHLFLKGKGISTRMDLVIQDDVGSKYCGIILRDVSRIAPYFNVTFDYIDLIFVDKKMVETLVISVK